MCENCGSLDVDTEYEDGVTTFICNTCGHTTYPNFHEDDDEEDFE